MYMALTQEDRQQIAEIIQGCTAGVNARVESQFTVIDNKLDGISKRLDVSNGRLSKHDEMFSDINMGRQKQRDWLETRGATCPNNKRIQDLETKDKIGMSLKSFIIGAIVLVCTVIGAVAATVKITESYDNKKAQVEVQQPINSQNLK